MRTKLFFTVVAVLTASSVLAGTLTVVSSFVSRKQWRKGIEVHGGYVYEASNYSDNNIMYYTTSGSYVGSIPAPSGGMGIEVSHAPSGSNGAPPPPAIVTASRSLSAIASA